MKLGILKCDTVREPMRGEFGDYDDMFINMFATINSAFDYRVYDVEQGELPAQSNECDAYLITGSRWGVYDEPAWIAALHDTVRQLHRDQTPMVGICFGHQLLANALGGKAEKSDKGWGLGVTTTELLTHTDFMQPELQSLRLLVSHQDQVTQLPADAQCLASSDFCRYAAFQLGEHVLAFQGHPEFAPGYLAALLTLRREHLGEDLFETGMTSLSQVTNQLVVARWIDQFLRKATET